MHLHQFVFASRPLDTDTPIKDVLWIHVPDFSHNGRMRDIHNITASMSNNTDFFESLEYVRETFPTEEVW